MNTLIVLTLAIIFIFGIKNDATAEASSWDSSYPEVQSSNPIFSKKTSGPGCLGMLRQWSLDEKKNLSLGLAPSQVRNCNSSMDAIQKIFKDSKGFASFIFEKNQDQLGLPEWKNYESCPWNKTEPHELASKMVYFLKRLKEGQLFQLKQLSYLNTVLGEPSGNELENSSDTMKTIVSQCSQSKIKEIAKVCSRISKCDKNPNKINRVVELTMNVNRIIKILSLVIQEIEKDIQETNNSSEDSNQIEERIKKLKSNTENIKLAIKTLESLIPWTQGEKYNEILKIKLAQPGSSKSEFPYREAIEGQFKQDRKLILSHMNALLKTEACVRGEKSNFECSDVKPSQISALTPELIREPISQNVDLMIMENELDSQQCRFDMKMSQEQLSDTMNSVLFDGTMLSASLVLGGSPILIRMLAAKNSWSTQRLNKILNTVTSWHKALDYSSLAISVVDAIQDCSRRKNVNENLRVELINKDCPVGDLEQAYFANYNNSICAVSSILSAIDIVKLLLSKKIRRKVSALTNDDIDFLLKYAVKK
ncbi:MAG: hypothetical protein J0M15_05650 [Deltaproteobacteria bacterium]|nr:hypothetical protein [Deltaproteobacteria bacterium]